MVAAIQLASIFSVVVDFNFSYVINYFVSNSFFTLAIYFLLNGERREENKPV